MYKYLIFLYILLFYSQEMFAMQNPRKRIQTKISKDEGTSGPNKKKYTTYNLQSPKNKDFKYKYVTHYPETDEYEITGELLSDTDPEVYRQIPKKTAEEIYYQYASEADRIQKVK
ncbi:hypothetical protein BH09DEP1_BH09DEP1_1630 [soil metagenome]